MRRLLLIALLLVPGPLHAAVSYVDNIGQCAGLTPCHPTIMEAVQASIPPATIEVFPGVYHEAVIFVSRGNVQLRSHDAGSRPVIVAPALESAVTIINSPGVLLSGFIVEAGSYGVGVHGGGSSYVILEGNHIRSGGGVYFNSVYGCVARDNTIDGGLLNMGGSQRCIVEGNFVRGRITFDEGRNCGPKDNQVRGNVVIGAGIAVSSRCTRGNAIVSNWIIGGSIVLRGSDATVNLIRGNVVRSGGLALTRMVSGNTVEDNFVSDSAEHGLLVAADQGAGRNLILRNTSVENAVCDIKEGSSKFSAPNLWLENRYVTRCGAAVEATGAGPSERIKQ